MEPKHPDPTNPIRAPYLPLATSRKIITTLFWCCALLTFVTVLLAIGFSISIQRKPWVVANFGKGYEELILERTKTTAQDVERYLNFVIPNLYGTLNGEAPGLQELRGIVNETIISVQQSDINQNAFTYRNDGISSFALVTGINPETLSIREDKNEVYVEAYGTIVLSQEKNSKKTDVQWRCLIYIVEPTDALMTQTVRGPQRGNKMGLYLQQIAEQEPGTINQDIPQRTLNR
jgi:hypothetical protein